MSESTRERAGSGDKVPTVESAGSSPHLEPPDEATAGLQRAVRIAAIVSAVLLVAFGAFYYVDRYVARGDRSPLEMSIDELESTVRSEPDNPDARLSLAEAYIVRERYGDALAQAGEVLDAYPDNERALLLLGIAHEKSAQPQAAIAVLESFVDLRRDTEMAHVDTTLEAAYFFLGRSYLAVGRPQDAAEALDAALVISPTDADALQQAGLAYQALNQHQAALEYFERATAFVPNFTEVYGAMAASYAAIGATDEQRYAQAMELYSTGRYQEALPELLQVTSTLPDFAPGYLGLALVYEQLGDLSAGIEAAQRALEIQSDYLAAEQTLGRLLQEQGSGG